MLAQALEIFMGKEHLAKKSADFHPRQGNLLQRKNFAGKPLFTSQNGVEIS
jgi:hypothetical protein